jgi:hypothetical protein
VLALAGRQLAAARDVVPFLEAPAAAGRGRVLRDEHGMPAPRRLLAVLGRVRRREATVDEVARVREDDGEAAGFEIGAIRVAEAEAAAKGGASEGGEQVVEGAQR